MGTISTGELILALALAREALRARGALDDYPSAGAAMTVGDILDRALGWEPEVLRTQPGDAPGAVTGLSRAPLSPALDAATRRQRKRARTRRLAIAGYDPNPGP